MPQIPESMATRKLPLRTRCRVPVQDQTLVNDIRSLIADAKAHVVSAANATLTLLYWRIGQRIRVEVLSGERAAYGEEIVVTLSRQLSLDHGSSFGEKNLRRMIQFTEVFPDEQIVVSLIRELSWKDLGELDHAAQVFLAKARAMVEAQLS